MEITNTIRMNGRGKGCGRKLSALVAVRSDPRGNVTFAAAGLELRPVVLNWDAAAWMHCEPCGTWHQLRKVEGKFKADKGCDGRCMSATGHNCECSCGGMNHGAAHGA